MAVNLKLLLLLAVLVGATVFCIVGASRVSDSGTVRQPVPKLDLICESCGHEVVARIRRGEEPFPMRCPACREKALVLAAYCREHKTTLPLLDSNAFVKSPYLAQTQFVDRVFPACPECGELMELKAIVMERKPE